MPSKPNINELYHVYLNELKPLIATIEGKYEIFPEGILNEIRALYDHTARLSILEMNYDVFLEEYNRATRHIHRAKLDCFKFLCTMGERNNDQFKNNYINVRLGEVNSGKFLPEYEKLKKIAINKTLEAKMQEKTITNNEKNVSFLYQEAILAYEEIEKFIELNYENLAWSASNQKQYSKRGYINAIIITAICGIGATIIGTMICNWLNIF